MLYREDFPREESDHIFSVEFLPGQFDQRADSAVQCIQFVKEDEQPVIRTATTYIIHGKNGAITEEELQKIKNYVGEERYHSGKFGLATEIFDDLVLNDHFEEFLTLKAYQFI